MVAMRQSEVHYTDWLIEWIPAKGVSLITYTNFEFDMVKKGLIGVITSIYMWIISSYKRRD